MRKTGGESDEGRKKDTEEKEGKEGRERERGAALAVHITLLTIRGQCHRVRPAAPLHFTWLHLAPPLRFSPACPPPPRFASPLTPSHTQRPLSPPRLSRRRCARAIASPLPHGHPPVVMPLLSSSLYPRPRPLLLYRRLLSRVSTSPSFSLPALSSCSCSVFHLVRPHRAFSSTVRVRGHGAPLRIISSRLPRLALAPPSLLRSLLLLLPLLSFFLPALLPPPLPSSSPIRLFPFPTPLDLPRSPLTVLLPCSCAQRGINYSKNLYCYYYRLTIPSQLWSQRRALESSTMRDSVRALPTTSTRRQRGRRRRRRVVDVWCHSGSPRRETRIDFTRVTFFFSLARAKKEDELRRRGHHVSTRLICMNTDERISRERILDRDVRVLKEHIGVFLLIVFKYRRYVIIFIVRNIIEKYRY